MKHSFFIIVVCMYLIGCSKQSSQKAVPKNDPTNEKNDSTGYMIENTHRHADSVAQPAVADSYANSRNPKFPYPIYIGQVIEKTYEDPSHRSLPEADIIFSGRSVCRAVIQSGEAMLLDSMGKPAIQLTFSGGNIDTLFVSPNGKYLACMQIVEWVDEPGEYDEFETPPKRPVYQVVFLNLTSHSTIRVLPPEPLYEFWEFERWISNSRALISTSEGFSVGDVYVYDAFRDSLQHDASGSLRGNW
jgi:hypothetical protein